MPTLNLSSQPPQTTLYLLSLPPSSYLGLDLSSFTVPPNFYAITAIPPGLHHVWLSVPPSLTLRHSLFFYVPPSTPFISLQYDPDTESLTRIDLPSPPPPPAREKSVLTPYRQRSPTTSKEGPSSREWEEFVAPVTEGVLTRVLGKEWTASTLSADPEEKDESNVELPGVSNEEEELQLHLIPIDLKRSWRAGAVGRERTEGARDKSWLLGEAISRAGSAKDLLGEWVLCFTLGVWLGNPAATTQWTKIVQLVLGCRAAVTDREREGFLKEFLGRLRWMTAALKRGIVGGGGFLGEEELAECEQLLRRFGTVLREEGVQEESGLGSAWRKFVGWGRREAGWTLDAREMLRRGTVMNEEGDLVEVEDESLDEEEEKGEYAPVVVELLEDTDAAIERRVSGEEAGKNGCTDDDDMEGLALAKQFQQDTEDDSRF